jgi:NAD(P)-dependent dehydrogenase (short-subunit alcohol dehydrogenase family)
MVTYTGAWPKTLSGKTAVITGGNSGIGLATAKLFVQQGAKVVIIGRDSKTLAAASQELGDKVVAIRADVSSIEQIVAAAKEVEHKLGKVDILFANAGIAEFRPMDQVDEASFDRTFDINVKGVFYTTQKFAPLLRDNGAVLFTTSVVNQKGWPGTSVYSASKAAVRSFARTLAAELQLRKIRVNAISPGPIDTPIYGRLGMPQEAVKELADGILKQTPMHRFGSADEVARVALFLASDQSSYLTGTEISVDGGLGQL